MKIKRIGKTPYYTIWNDDTNKWEIAIADQLVSHGFKYRWQAVLYVWSKPYDLIIATQVVIQNKINNNLK